MAAHTTVHGAGTGQVKTTDVMSDLLRKVERPAVWLCGVAFSVGVWSLVIAALANFR